MPPRKTKSTTPRTLSPAVRKAQILEAARSLLVEKGYGELLLDEVARRAGVAKGTLYLHFSDKREIFSAVMEGILEGLEVRVREVAARDGDPMGKLEMAVSQVLEYVDDNKDFFLLMGPVSPRHRLLGLKKGFERYLSALESVIAPAVKAGFLRAHEAGNGAMVIIAFSRMFMMRKVFHERSEPLKSCTKELLDLLLHGLGARGRS